MMREKVTIFGCGGWGERIARKLAQRADVRLVLVDDDRRKVEPLAAELGADWTSDPFGYLTVTGTATSSVEGGSVIVATPPDTRVELVRAIVNGYGVPPKRLRIEKPLAIEEHDGLAIAALCAEHDVDLSVGFTLLHHYLYEHAFAYIKAHGVGVVRVCGTRIGRRARHRVAAVVDLGSHTASIAAYLGASCSLHAEFSETAQARRTQIQLDTGESIYIDELDGTVALPTSWMVDSPHQQDALEADLDAWLSDRHRGDRRVALGALFVVQDHLDRMAVAA